PAKWTGNGARASKPDINDWYETVKVNYGVKPDGTYDFPVLPEEYSDKSFEEHAAFWQGKDVPDSWYKFRDIAHYWIDKGVDGFRYDMAEMVPVEFWSFLNSSIKQKTPNAFLLAEVYQPDKYREYIHQGKMDYLYDKVGFYDTLKTIMQGSGEVSKLVTIHDEINDIAPHMLHFLENHDEQRIASPDFAGSAQKGKPALAVSALISSSPTLLYFGQDVGEDGSEETGFGDPTRTSIFDYVGVPAHQRFMNDGKFDAGKSTEDEKALHQFYQDVMAIAATNPAVTGEYQSLHALNLDVKDSAYTEQQFAFVRAQGEHGFVVVANFNDKPTGAMKLVVPSNVFGEDSDRITLASMLSHEGITLEKEGIYYNASFSLEGLETKVFAF
ncbi:MAG TPA: alpha-amylase, partial [Alteromonas australica]|nr:alpha-amylase [Alteromonas australica]